MGDSGPATPPAKRARIGAGSVANHAPLDITGSIIRVRVQGEVFNIHENIIFRVSPFFREAKERERNIRLFVPDLELHDTQSDTFKAYVAYLYSQDLHKSLGDISSFLPIVRCYILGQLTRDTKFQEAVIDEAIAFIVGKDTIPGPRAINEVCEKTPKDSPFRKLLVDVFAWSVNESLWSKYTGNSSQLDRDFKCEVLDAMMAARSPPSDLTQAPFKQNMGQYKVMLNKENEETSPGREEPVKSE